MLKKLPSLAAFLFPRLQDVFFIGILLAGVFYGNKLFNLDGDLGRHITIGNYIIEYKTIPVRDIFSHTLTGKTLVPHEWLAQVLFSAANSLMELNGVVILTVTIIAATFTLTYREIVSRNVFRLIALSAGLWAAMTSSLHWLARPHIFTFLFLAIWTYHLDRVAKKKTDRIWVFPILMLIWVNTHGAFIAGFVVLGAHAVEWLWEFINHRADVKNGRALFIIGVSSILASLINPSGYRLWGTSLGYVSNNYLVDHTIEYMSPDFHLGSMWPFLIMLAFFLFALGQGVKIKLRESILLAGWAAMALYSARNIPLFAIVAAPILGALIQSSAEKIPFLARQDENLKRIDDQLRGILLPFLSVLMLAFASMQNEKLVYRFDPSIFPVHAVNWLEENPQDGNVFNYFTWGGYLLYREWPKVNVFIDGQTDFYGEALTREYERVISVSSGWETIFEKYDIKWVIIPRDSALANTLQTEHGWRILYSDNTAAILRK
ncbi:MAG: hypothetical protein HY864_08215 [Chloroflexi bacterium]|nr:hypothetical protein [Chloroflexota bacterium]